MTSNEAQPVVVDEKESNLHRFFTWPLDIPPLAVRLVAYPFKAFFNYAEKIHLPTRTVDFFSNEDRTAFWYPVFKAGGAGGAYFGVGAFHRKLFGKNYFGNLTAQVSPALDQDMYALFRTPSFVGRAKLRTSLSIRWERRRGDDFWGLGNNTANTYLEYETRQLKVRVPLSGKITKQLSWTVFGKLLLHKTADNDDPGDTLAGNFPSRELLGLEQFVTGGEFGAGLSLDTRRLKGTPRSGTTIDATFRRFQGNNMFAFYRTKASVAQYLTLFNPRQVIVVGGHFEAVHKQGSNRIPFSMLPYLGGSSKLRAFRSFRFRDHVSLLIVGEYRYPIWRFMDGMLFLEGGRVADRVGNLDPSDFHVAYGGGIRFRTPSFFVFQIQGAAGSEGVRVAIAFNQAL